MAVFQFLLAAAACFGLWRLCRSQPRIVVAGFLVRALLGQALFWISYLRLPFARSLQSGQGFWFFAVDGPFYLGYATELASQGPLGFFRELDRYPSRFFVQVLSLCVSAFGSVASVAILLNCAAYLVTCWLIVRVARSRNRIVLAAIAFSPAGILFSLQPLKDTLFVMLIVATVVAFGRWEEALRARGPQAQLLGYAFAACALLFALSGIRWYFSVIAWGAAAIFLLLIALRGQRKGWMFAASAVLVIVMAQSIRGGASDLPATYDRLLNPITALQWRPAATREHLADVKRGFDSTPGATTIVEGVAIAKPAAVPVAPAIVTPAEPTPPPEPVASPRTTTRILTGFSAMFLPRMVGQSLGLIHVGGGRGLWLFAEADTIVFDLVLLYAIFYSVRALKKDRAAITATFVFCLLVFVMTAGPLLYAVNNFGTLFRLRLMVYCLAAILPITLRSGEVPEPRL